MLHTLKQSSSGRLVKGSFFSRGLTNSCTKPNCWLLHMLSSSARSLCFAASFMPAKRALTSRICSSSWSAAVLQSGTRCCGVGLGAGVGGDAGADGRRLCGIEDDIGLLGVCIGRGRGKLRRLRLVGEGKMVDDPAIDAAKEVSESTSSFKCMSSTSSMPVFQSAIARRREGVRKGGCEWGGGQAPCTRCVGEAQSRKTSRYTAKSRLVIC